MNISFKMKNIADNTKHGLVVSCVSARGGAGKTSVALLTATMFYQASLAATNMGLRDEPLKVCVVDLDIRDGQVGFLLSHTKPTAADLFLEKEKSIQNIERNLVYDEKLGVYALVASKSARTANILTPEFYSNIIESLTNMFDIIILDASTSYVDPLINEVVLPKSNIIMFVANVSNVSVSSVDRWLAEFEFSEKEKVNVILNKHILETKLDNETLEFIAGSTKILSIIPSHSAISNSYSKDNLADIIRLHSDLSSAFYKVVTKLLPNEIFINPLEIVEEPIKQNSIKSLWKKKA
jgi:MinD-like ATPase involved in chromosome partitioning or flagellar assembly